MGEQSKNGDAQDQWTFLPPALNAVPELGIQIEKGIRPPPLKKADPFHEQLRRLRLGGTVLTTQSYAVAFRKRAMRCGYQVCFRTTHENPGRPVTVSLMRTGCLADEREGAPATGGQNQRAIETAMKSEESASKSITQAKGPEMKNAAVAESPNDVPFEFDKDVPIPPARGFIRGYWIRMLSSMTAGDSFLTTAKNANLFATAARGMGHCVTTRKTRESEDRPVRVWLTKKREGNAD